MRVAMVLGSAVMLAACSGQVNKVVVRTDTLPAQATAKVQRLVCAFQLVSLRDARAASSHAGGLGRHQLVLEDAPGLVQQHLQRAGMAVSGGPVAPDAHRVALEIKQLYLTQVQSIKVPVAVYNVQVDDGPGFLVRSQAASINWNGTQDEAKRAFARAVDDASQRLVVELNKRCG